MTIYKTVLKNIDNPNWKNPLNFNRAHKVAHLAGTLTMIDVYLRDKITVPTPQTALDIDFQLYFYGRQNECSWTELARDTEQDLTTLLDCADSHSVNVDMVKRTIERCRNFIDAHVDRKEPVSSAESSSQRRCYNINYLS